MKHTLLNIIGICAVVIAVAFAVFINKEKQMRTGINLNDMDTTVVAGDDFYDFATKGWRNANPIPNDYSRYGVFDVLVQENDKRVRKKLQKQIMVKLVCCIKSQWMKKN